ncbi:exostosin domain-containing protein [Flavobacterium taihuense]|uniref:Glycosyltransferase family 47 protein n=1 Tax=Flavobacterium taihuense TaxID=2857508 RepID=A0ABS6XUW7_9FLAO|nr:exostosin family protein [Flavobacterium taihuense]MBW4360384.1 glycosyltransferase family 47 protein [Flavobacterium taihuense]
MIKIYTDTTFITPANRKIVFPLLFELCYLKNVNLLEKYKLVDSISESDIAVLPVDINFLIKNKQQSYLNDFISVAKAQNKIIWAYSAGDFGKTVQDDIYLFRLGGFNSKMNDKTNILPSFIHDPYGKFIQKEFVILEKESIPSIGFVGNANGSLKSLLKEFGIYLYVIGLNIKNNFYSDYQSFYPSGYKRYQLLKKIKADSRVKSDFIFRKKHSSASLDTSEIKKTTIEFYENMYENPYVFCLRGLGNFSVRLYETLAMGRIPVVVDTDIRLPFHKSIDWKRHCVFVTEVNFVDQLLRFHDKISNQDFIEMQENNRKLFLNVLSRENYFVEWCKKNQNK